MNPNGSIRKRRLGRKVGVVVFFALDINGKRVNAEDGFFEQCICPACRNPVIQKNGDYRRSHFAHKRKNPSCPFEYNGDYKNMSEWHIRMQEYFPKETREHIFTDDENGERHIADVYIKKSETVIEFQYSTIKKDEFLSRTKFHLRNGRRIAWLFDESWKDREDTSYSKQYYKNGKLEKHVIRGVKGPYSTKSYKWLYRRKCVDDGPTVYAPNYSVCLFTGAEGDVFHRIISFDASDHKLITVSLHDISMTEDLDVEEFFFDEDHWKKQESWKSEFELLETEKKQTDWIEHQSVEYRRRYAEYEELGIRMKKNRVKQKEEREDYWKALLEFFEDLDNQRKRK